MTDKRPPKIIARRAQNLFLSLMEEYSEELMIELETTMRDHDPTVDVTHLRKAIRAWHDLETST